MLSLGILLFSATICFVEHKQINTQRRNAMDRSMKVMFGMMSVAICMLAITMMNTQSKQAYAGEYLGGADRGTEPTIVSFRVTPLSGGAKYNLSGNTMSSGTSNTYAILLTRMWSDGAVEINVIGKETLPSTSEGTYYIDWVSGHFAPQAFEGWKLVTDSVAGYACAGDTDGDREVDVHDLLAVVEQWGQCEEDPTTGLPDDPDLM
ncbi:MAG: hypothetical protein ACI9JK_000483 [Phycisphaerales bacterium]|jgi:hypothetical protein